MLNMIRNRQIAMKKNRKRGFTLIELIVVIVIIAILAAIAVPSLTRYIGSAEMRSVQATAHNIQVVLQAEKADRYNEPFNSPATGAVGTDPIVTTDTVTYIDVLSANGVSLDGTLSEITWDGNTLAKFKYSTANYSITYDFANGGFGDVS